MKEYRAKHAAFEEETSPEGIPEQEKIFSDDPKVIPFPQYYSDSGLKGTCVALVLVFISSQFVSKCISLYIQILIPFLILILKLITINA